MKYKQLYLDSQKRFAKKLELLRLKYGDIHSIVCCITNSLDGRRRELSPELYQDLNDELNKIIKVCGDMLYNFEDYYNEADKI